MYTPVTRSRGYLRDSMPCHVCSCSLPSARSVTGCRALLPRYSRLIRLCWVFSAVSSASCNEVGVVQQVSSSVILLPCCNKIHAVPQNFHITLTLTDGVLHLSAKTTKYKAQKLIFFQFFFQGLVKHSETTLGQIFATGLASKQRGDPGTVHRKQQK